MSQARFVRLTNGVLFDLENVAFLLKVDLTKYAVMPKISASAQAPLLEGHEYDELIETLKELGVLVEVKKLPRIAANDAK